MSNWSPEPHELFPDNDPYRELPPDKLRTMAMAVLSQFTVDSIGRTILESDWFAEQIALCLEELANDYTEITSTELRHIAEDVRARVL